VSLVLRRRHSAANLRQCRVSLPRVSPRYRLLHGPRHRLRDTARAPVRAGRYRQNGTRCTPHRRDPVGARHGVYRTSERALCPVRLDRAERARATPRRTIPRCGDSDGRTRHNRPRAGAPARLRSRDVERDWLPVQQVRARDRLVRFPHPRNHVHVRWSPHRFITGTRRSASTSAIRSSSFRSSRTNTTAGPSISPRSRSRSPTANCSRCTSTRWRRRWPSRQSASSSDSSSCTCSMPSRGSSRDTRNSYYGTHSRRSSANRRDGRSR